VILAHASEECNESGIAYQAAKDAVRAAEAGTSIFSSKQQTPGRQHELTPASLETQSA